MAHVCTRKFYVLFICIVGIKGPILAQVSDSNGAFTVTGCPLGPIIGEVDTPDTYVTISWDSPKATSTTYSSISSSFTGTLPGNLFPVDVTITNTYTWVDSSNRDATCTFNVRAQRPNIFTMITCPPANLMVNATTRVATWSTPPPPTRTSPAQGGLTLIVENHSSGSVFPVGETTVLLTWTDDIGNFALCEFTVSVPAPNPCAGVVCQNDGICTNGVCNCINGYNGTFCETTSNTCAGVVCQNGGVCTNGACNCINGYTGTFCETAPNPCAGVICQNGGVCTNGICICINEYTGTFCKTAPNPCAGIVCQNGGVCTNGFCYCLNGYTGTFCETAPNPCAGVVCQNGGSCTNGVCNCNNGYAGTFCEIVEYSPISATVESVLVTSITFSWSEATCPGLCPDGITGYSYRLLQTGTEAEVESGTTGANERMVTITGLMPCTEYSFSVAGIGGSNTNNYSDAVFVTTAGEVSGLSIEALSSSELKVAWETSTDSCRDNLEYGVEYRLINRDQCQPLDTDDAKTVILSLSGTFITLPNLFPHSTYEVRVRNGDAETTMSAITKESEPSGAPTDITATTTNTTISISWSQPPCSQRNGNITSYTYIFLKTGSSTPIVQDIATSDTSVIFNNLEVATEYSFIVSANTKVGAGPQAFFQSQTLKEGGTSAQVNSGVIAGSVIAVIIVVVIIVIVAVVIYRKSSKGPNDAPYEVNISPAKAIEMSSRNPAYQRDKDQRVSTGDYENPERAQSGYYEDLDKKGMAKEQEYQDLDQEGKKMEVQQPGYQNVTMIGKTLGPVEEFDYEVPEPADRKKSSGLYEDLNKGTMDSKNSEYQDLREDKERQYPYQNVHH